MTGSSTCRLLALIVALTSCALAGCHTRTAEDAAGRPDGSLATAGAGATYHGTRPVAPYEMPDVTLVATDGRPFHLIRDTGYPVTLVFFGYTHCTDVCPLVMNDLTAAYLRLDEEVRDRTQVLYVTTDPARDSVKVLRGYLAGFDPSYVGLTGDLEQIVAAGKAMGVAIEGMERLPGGGYDVGHSTQVVGFRDDLAPVYWTEGTPVGDLVDDITTLSGPSGPVG